jgi:hypothetical protein
MDYHCHECLVSLILALEVGGRKLLRNIGNCLPVDTVSHLKRPKSSFTLLTEPQISHILQANAYLLKRNATHRRITEFPTTDIFNCNQKYRPTLIGEHAVFRNLNGSQSNNTRVIAKSPRVREERVLLKGWWSVHEGHLVNKTRNMTSAGA